MCSQTPTHLETEAERETKSKNTAKGVLGNWVLGLPAAPLTPRLHKKQNCFGVGIRSSQEEENTMALPTMPHLQAASHGQRTISQSAAVTKGKRQ